MGHCGWMWQSVGDTVSIVRKLREGTLSPFSFSL